MLGSRCPLPPSQKRVCRPVGAAATCAGGQGHVCENAHGSPAHDLGSEARILPWHWQCLRAHQASPTHRPLAAITQITQLMPSAQPVQARLGKITCARRQLLAARLALPRHRLLGGAAEGGPGKAAVAVSNATARCLHAGRRRQAAPPLPARCARRHKLWSSVRKVAKHSRRCNLAAAATHPDSDPGPRHTAACRPPQLLAAHQ